MSDWPCGCDYCNGIPSEAELAAAQLADHGDLCDCYECHQARTTLDGDVSTPDHKPPRMSPIAILLIALIVVAFIMLNYWVGYA